MTCVSCSNRQFMQPPYVATFLFLNTMGYLLQKKMIRAWTTAVASQYSRLNVAVTLADIEGSRINNDRLLYHSCHSSKCCCQVPGIDCGGFMRRLSISRHLAGANPGH